MTNLASKELSENFTVLSWDFTVAPIVVVA